MGMGRGRRRVTWRLVAHEREVKEIGGRGDREWEEIGVRKGKEGEVMG